MWSPRHALLDIAVLIAGSAWLWPVGPSHVVIHPYAAPQSEYGAGHRGIDIAASQGSTVLAPADGVVSFAGVVVDRPVLTLNLGAGILASFEPVSSSFTVGAMVHRGQAIGTLATGGHCSAGCLHFGVRRHGDYVSPLLFLSGIPHSVLLPTRTLSSGHLSWDGDQPS